MACCSFIFIYFFNWYGNLYWYPFSQFLFSDLSSCRGKGIKQSCSFHPLFILIFFSSQAWNWAKIPQPSAVRWFFCRLRQAQAGWAARNPRARSKSGISIEPSRLSVCLYVSACASLRLYVCFPLCKHIHPAPICSDALSFQEYLENAKQDTQECPANGTMYLRGVVAVVLGNTFGWMGLGIEIEGHLLSIHLPFIRQLPGDEWDSTRDY